MQCPKCKKDTLKFLPWLGQIYQCYNPKCGYRGSLIIKKSSKGTHPHF